MAKAELKCKWLFTDCPKCNAKTTFNDLHRHDSFIEEAGEEYATRLVRCEVCNQEMLITQEIIASFDDKEVLGTPYRLWPSEQFVAPDGTPNEVKVSLFEAIKCFKGGAFIATVVMCGRALEAICKNKGAKITNLDRNLKDLHDRKVIDDMIYDWSNTLRVARNIGAHDIERQFDSNDAEDILEFLVAICDYVYRLSSKYQTFKERLNTQKKANADG